MENKFKILIVVDMQNDFITGSLGTLEAQGIIPNVISKIKEYKKREDLIIFTRDTHFSDYLDTNEGKHLPVEHCINRTLGWELQDEIKELADSIKNKGILDKVSFGYPDWKKLINVGYEGKDLEIELIGLCTDICVVSNALILKALYPEATIKVDSSCCAGVTPETHESALITMKMCQIEII